jgi:uncharacterized protein (DUF305 family)
MNARSSALWIAVAALCALGGWFFGRSSITYPLEGSPEVTFARDMRAHHEQAVDMSLRILTRTSDQELRLFATDILLTQQNQAGQMTAWLTLWGRAQSGSSAPMAGMQGMMGMASAAQVQQISTLPVSDAQILFLQLMYRHHEGGIRMAQTALDGNPRSEVARLASGIVNGQRVELKVIESLLRRFGGALPAPLEPSAPR